LILGWAEVSKGFIHKPIKKTKIIELVKNERIIWD
jgi:hypothetical protein